MAFTAGAAVMTVELMGVRLMAPWFGQSQIVWTNVIGVVLAALAAGQWLGGRWCESGRGRGAGVLLLGSGALCMAMPLLVEHLAWRLLPAELTLADASGFVAWGSLLVSMLALGLPMLALGAVTPWLVRSAREATTRPGGVAGMILAAGTLGSLLGTFGSTYLLLPAWGSASTVRGSGLVLAILGILVTRWERRRAGAWWLLWVIPASAVLAGPVHNTPVPIMEVETRYQWARIVEDEVGRRLLRLNEGFDSFHSAYWPGQVMTGLYFDAFVLPALLAPPAEDGVRKVMIIGLGGGTMARLIHAAAPDIAVTGVEIDGELISLGREWLGFDDSMAVVASMDGRMALHASQQAYGAIILDAYSDQIYIPHHLSTREFFELVRSRLRPGGVMAANLGGITREDPVIGAVVSTIRSVFSEVEMARVPGSRNWVLLAWNGEPPGMETRSAALADTMFADTLDWAVDGSHFAEAPAANGVLLVDGDAPVEALAHRAWRRRR